MLRGGTLCARGVHRGSARAGRPVEAVVCTAVEGLPLEECGYRRHPASDARSRRVRRLRMANEFEGSLWRTETAVVVVVGCVQAVAALLVHRAPGGSHAHRQEGGRTRHHQLTSSHCGEPRDANSTDTGAGGMAIGPLNTS
eukprot:scaffold22335_cov71-Phaeocystis_antarctica.AAC.2